MKEYLKNKSIGFYAVAGGGIIGLVSTLLYLIYSVTVSLFSPLIFIMLLLGVIGSVFAIFTEYKFAPIIPCLFYSLAFGFYIDDRIIMFEEMINNIYGMSERGAILEIVIVIFVLCFISIATSMVAAFTFKNKTDKMGKLNR